MRQLLVLGGMVAALFILPATANADWMDQFDAYAPGSQIIGQGGWEGWDGSPAAGALVSSAFSRSPGNSVEIVAGSDLIHQYSGYTSGKWIYTAWQYIPSDMVGQPYFLIQNTYNHFGPYSWSVQTWYLDTDGLVHGNFGSGNDTTGPAFITDQWVQIRVSIDLDNDWTQVYYNNVLIDDPTVADHPILGGGYSWSGDIFGGGGGVLDIASVDLFANGSTPVYYDDISLLRAHRWMDDFEAYAPGSQIVGQGGWEEWGAGAGALVSNAFARSGANSVDVNGATDLVYRYEGYTEGKVAITAWQYIPTGYSGQSYWVMLDQYTAGGPYNWVMQFYFDAASGNIGGWFGGGNIMTTTAFKLDQWAEIKIVAHFDEDWCQIFYDGTLLDDPAVGDHPTLGGGYQWSTGYSGGQTCTNNIGALDLFANSASSVYYDDVTMNPLIPQLKGDVEFISEAAGGQCNFVLNSGFQNGFRNYIILSGLTGIDPGTPLPGGFETLPLNWDAFTTIAIGLINSPVMANFLGTTDNIGVTTAVFDTLGPQTGLATYNIYFACTMNNPFDYASNGWSIRFLP